MSDSRCYLNCPFAEKDEVKAMGAKFDGATKQWFVPETLYATIYQFNRWRPNNRIYLDCPYAEKDEVKKAGARWDGNVKSWYCVIATNAKTVPAKFHNWLTVSPFGDNDTASSPSSDTPHKISQSSKFSPTPSKKRGNANSAATLRISNDMTVSQLQDECRHRGISGFSGKSKPWLLEQLGVGSNWLVMANTRTNGSPPAKKSKGPSTPVQQVTVPKPTKTKATPTVTSAKTLAKKKKSHTIDFSILPRVSTDMTVAQLSHELLHRHPSTQGLSNKTKAWLIQQLGEGSIWTTKIATVDFSHVPTVAPDLTKTQLTHEIMSRMPDCKGLSTKSKADLLQLVGVGSLWTTGPIESGNETATVTKDVYKKAPPSSTKQTIKRPPKPEPVRSFKTEY